MNSMKIALMAASALAFDAGLIYYAYRKKQQFYPTVIYLTKTRIFLTAFTLQLLALIFHAAYLTARLFFGSFQRLELDNLISRYWFAFVDVCLIFASFQEELTLGFLFTFTLLMIVKGFHWLLEERVDFMQITPNISRKFHIRAVSLIILLTLIDLNFVRHIFDEPKRPHELVYLAIGAEYCVLFLSLISTTVRYIFHSIEAARSQPWDEKRTYLLITDVIISSKKLLVYLNFLTTLWKFHPLPLFLIRPIYLCLRFLSKSVQDLYLSRRAIQYMNTVFKDATEEDFSGSADKTCIICFEEMQVSSAVTESAARQKIKKLPCGHMFHFSCLRDWFLTHQNCPTCRLDVISQIRNPNRQQNANRNRAAQPGAPQQNSSSTNQPTTSQQPSSQQQQNPPYGMGQAEWYNYFQNNMFASMGQSQNATAPASATGTSPTPPPFTMMPNCGMPLCMPIILPGNAFSSGAFPTSFANPSDAPGNPSESYLDEAALRSSVEARMAALRQVQNLLDAATLQMNAYLSATAQEAVKTPGSTNSN